MLMLMESQPAEAVTFMPESMRTADLNDTLLGVCLDVLNGKDPKRWSEQISWVSKELQAMTPPQAVPPTDMMLMDIALGDMDGAKKRLDSFKGSDFVFRSMEVPDRYVLDGGGR
jgi:hypothetical protein